MPVELDLAENLEHALELLSAADPEVRPVAGASDVLLKLHAGRFAARRLVSIADLPELSFFDEGPDAIRIGAGTTLTALLEQTSVHDALRGAVEAARQFASPQIRNRATFGGNIGNASPAADLVPPLLALRATVTLCSKQRGERSLPLDDVFLGFGKTALQPDELMTCITVPRRRQAFQAFSKFGSRGANVIAVVNSAVCLELTDGVVSSAGVALGSVAPRPQRAATLEKLLLGRTLDAKLFAEMPAALEVDVKPIDDVRGSKRYKLMLAVGSVRRALEGARA